MNDKVLVAYATKYGATAGIAEKIGQVLGRAGFATDVLPADRVKNLDAYRAVILGSAVYIGRWRKAAAKFLKSNEKVLANKLVWLFSSGPTDKGNIEELMKGWRFPTSLQPIADRIHPKDIAIFHGATDIDKLSWLDKWMIKKVKAPIGDFRDWEAISNWAAAIAEELKARVMDK
ncbi:MAG: flavodoxin domain-containing protein [candidate division KSB1 bacterium]|nr:flavodoxin domain-containing protein [candidate division KSB1 bacterium]MDZ7357755.1 flavodoxin domain-containing protein [candidate division KSB1 bacterium]MDZ7400236.1 flavodoxin domain-containing protein [candidate division KSB1 bacterium]